MQTTKLLSADLLYCKSDAYYIAYSDYPRPLKIISTGASDHGGRRVYDTRSTHLSKPVVPSNLRPRTQEGESVMAQMSAGSFNSDIGWPCRSRGGRNLTMPTGNLEFR